MMNKRHLLGALGAAMLAAPRRAAAQGAGTVPGPAPGAAGPDAAANFPDRPIRIVMPYAPGGTNDVLARLYGSKLTELLGQPVVVENRSGAQGIVGTEAVVHAAPDGYTLLMGSLGPIVFNALTYDRLPYDSRRDLVPVAKLLGLPLLLSVSASSPYRTFAELIAAAKAQPGRMTYGASTAAFQFATELLNLRAGTSFTYVAYRGSGDSANAVANNEVTMTLSEGGSQMPGIEGGRLRALAVTSARRLPNLPDVPTMTELGFPEITIDAWSALFAPRGTPQPVVNKLADALLRITAMPDVQQRLAALYLIPSPGGPEALRAEVEALFEKWGAVARTVNIRLER
ncbi:Bug family tripartite tricarboxylate transporter substrate binding protein [Roseomonas sp. BN140053]|uniref:Bug family tripartite tricarboxylate transporter substrate binding protein n=1 Tax=Roseomonas sp. BN140053 TaxID=3391898 RepID=UPI0039E8DB57